MGVTGLWKLIEQSGKPVPLDTLENKVLAVDISIWLHQVVKGFQDSSGATLHNAHLLGLFHRLCKLLYYRIKPVFVFDGGVPPLKRETMAKRARNKSKYQSEADKLQQLLLESLAKEKVVQQALGPSTSALLSPLKDRKKVNEKADDENDLFKLPPLPEDAEVKDHGDNDTSTDLSDFDESYGERYRRQYNQNLRSIDVTSAYFQTLPADIRHEILSDLKEMRKESSWGRLHELPVESRSFSNFQMDRLLKRRRVQVELEGAEKEMGGRSLSLAELEDLLSAKGVVDPDICTNRIASNEHVRYIYVRDVKQAIEREQQRQSNPSPPKKPKVELVDDDVPMSAEDIALQKAIQLSLGCEPTKEEGDEDSEANTSNESIKMTTQQRKALGTAATSLARNYMIEYGGMNDDDVADLVKLNETVQPHTEFKYNDESIFVDNSETNVALNEKKEIPGATPATKKYKDIVLSDTSEDEGVSSDADSDFIDVPEISSQDALADLLASANKPLPKPFLMNATPLPDASKDFRIEDLQRKDNTKLEIVIDPTAPGHKEEDIFADIFAKSPADQVLVLSEDDDDDAVVEVKEKIESKIDAVISVDTESLTKQSATIASLASIPIENKNMSRILNDLDEEMAAATKIDLNDILLSSDSATKIDIAEILKQPSLDEQIGEKLQSKIVNDQTTPTKIVQPFFVRKTPPSSKKKNQQSSQSTNASPNKATKSLLDAFESLPVPATVEATSPADEKKTLEAAANVLRENKSEAELKEIAAQISQDRSDLLAERNKKDRMGVSITEQMTNECKDLLRLFGVPYVVAPMEAEAQCAFLNEINLTDGTITDDSDIWLFGGQTVYKNFFDQNKLVMEFRVENIKKLFHLERNEMIQLSMLVGSDYTPGISGIGTVTALEVLSLFSATPVKDGETTPMMSILSGLRKFREWWLHKRSTHLTAALRSKLKNIAITDDFPSARVAEAYLFPTVDENNETFAWGHPELMNIREYARRTFGWTNLKTDEIFLPVVKRMNEKVQQQSIKNYFKVTATETRADLKVSSRMRKALDQFSMDIDPEAEDGSVEIVEKKKPKRKATATATKAKKPKAKTTDQSETGDVAGGETESKVKQINGGDKPQAKTKKPRKGRKKQTTVDVVESIDGEEPCCSSSLKSAKKINLPDASEPIPQREKDREIMEQNRLKAIEVLKKQKKQKKQK